MSIIDRPTDSKYGERIGRTTPLAIMKEVSSKRKGRNFRDPKILLSLLTWAVYLILLYTRWNAGWRGRRAAYLAAGTFALAIVAWAANYFSAVHRLSP